MAKVVIFGNSGSGKSTLANRIAKSKSLAHLDLDTISWKPSSPPERLPINQSNEIIQQFIEQNTEWIIEGCYSDLLQIVLSKASEVIFLNLPVKACIQNAKSRSWEPHKYASKEAQDDNLDMLIDWIKQYHKRTDSFSKSAHENLFNQFSGPKVMFTSNEHRV